MGVENIQSYITYPTWQKYMIISQTIRTLQVKDKRGIFQTLRNEQDHDTFFPHHGITAGTFCIWQVIGDNKRPRKRET